MQKRIDKLMDEIQQKNKELAVHTDKIIFLKRDLKDKIRRYEDLKEQYEPRFKKTRQWPRKYKKKNKNREKCCKE